MIPPDQAPASLYAWVGLDELGSGEVGIKAGVVPAGYVPLVAKDEHKINTADLRYGLARQARTYGTTIRLVRYVPVEVIVELHADKDSQP